MFFKNVNFVGLKALLICALVCYGCAKNEKDLTEVWKKEILETETNFAQMAKDKGIHMAFLNYAAEDAVLLRQDSLIKGKIDFDAYFKANASTNMDIELFWKPDYVDVASSGDLGYTYGKYTLTLTDTTGQKINKVGVFHTVWKRQADGSWRFVWD